MSTPHIDAKKGDIAETILLPGDPLRAQYIAENFLTNIKLYNNIRGMLGYTGFYKGKCISVQGTGMGIPSISIYVHELINEFCCKNLIRVGTAGSLQKDIKVKDIVVALSASTNSNINRRNFPGIDYAPTISFKLFQKLLEIVTQKNIKINAGNIMSNDEFYDDDPNSWKKLAKFGVLAVEMETVALYTLANKFGVNALSLCCISDSLVTGEAITSLERQTTLNNLIELGLEIAIK